MHFKQIIILISALLMLSACKSSLYKPTLVEIKDTNEYNAMLKGRMLYISHCGSCHNLYLPGQFNAEKWKDELEVMSIKAKLSDSDKVNIFKYLTYKKQ